MMVLKRPFLLLSLAVMWMMLQDSYSLDYFLAGLLLGALVLIIFPVPVLKHEPLKWDGVGGFFKWLAATVRLILYFFWQVILANWQVGKIVVNPKLPVQPGILGMKLKAKSQGQITLLAALITLTPGTVSIDVSDKKDVLYIHSIDASDEDGTLSVPRRFEEMIMEVIP